MKFTFSECPHRLNLMCVVSDQDLGRYLVIIFRRVRKIAISACQLRHVCVSVRPSARYNAAPTGWIYVKSNISIFFWQSVGNPCSRPHACCLSVSCHTDCTLQFSLALATAVSVFIWLWFSEVKISCLGEWASQWRPPHTLCLSIATLVHERA